jgi:hypothetical protein
MAGFKEIMGLQSWLNPGHKPQWGNTPEAYKSGSQYTLLNRVPSGKFNRVKIILTGWNLKI